MLPLNLSFRKMVRKYIPQITSEDLNNYENLVALRYQLVHEINIVPEVEPQQPPGKQKKEDSQQNKNSGNVNEPEPAPTYREILRDLTTTEMNNILKNYKKEFEAALQLWIARKQFALEQGYFLQIPNTRKGFGRFISTAYNYRKVQVKTLPTLWKNRTIYFFKNLSWGKVIAIAIVVVLVVIGFKAVNMKDKIPGGEPGQPGDLLKSDSTAIVQPGQEDTTTKTQ